MSKNNTFKRISYKKLQVKNIKFTNLLENEDDDDSKMQYSGYARYGDKNLVVQLAPTKIDWGGVPGVNDRIHKTMLAQSKNVTIPLTASPDVREENDKQRQERQLQLDNIKTLVVNAFDEYMTSKEVKEQLFGSLKAAKKVHLQSNVETL